MNHRLTEIAKFSKPFEKRHWRFYCECGEVGAKQDTKALSEAGHTAHKKMATSSEYGKKK